MYVLEHQHPNKELLVIHFITNLILKIDLRSLMEVNPTPPLEVERAFFAQAIMLILF